jgi:hypothetical protein
VLGRILFRLDWINGHAAEPLVASTLVEVELRTLNAIHVATAELLVASGKSLAAFVTYDKRLADAAARVGLPIAAPG